MYLVNLMEDKVSKLADSYLKSKNIPVNSNMRMDIIVYTLNRVKPKYVTSARGVLHSVFDKDSIQVNADILSIIADACEIVRRRENDTLLDFTPSIEENGNYLVYPSILGNVYSSNNFEKVDEALVYIYNKNTLLEGYGTNFPNPAIVSEHVPGKFMFCFLPQKIETKDIIQINLDIVVESKKYSKYKSTLSFKITPNYYNKGDIPLFSVEEVDDILLIEEQDSNNNV